jgi:hypothetical protein
LKYKEAQEEIEELKIALAHMKTPPPATSPHASPETLSNATRSQASLTDPEPIKVLFQNTNGLPNPQGNPQQPGSEFPLSGTDVVNMDSHTQWTDNQAIGAALSMIKRSRETIIADPDAMEEDKHQPIPVGNTSSSYPTTEGSYQDDLTENTTPERIPAKKPAVTFQEKEEMDTDDTEEEIVFEKDPAPKDTISISSTPSSSSSSSSSSSASSSSSDSSSDATSKDTQDLVDKLNTNLPPNLKPTKNFATLDEISDSASDSVHSQNPGTDSGTMRAHPLSSDPYGIASNQTVAGHGV